MDSCAANLKYPLPYPVRRVICRPTRVQPAPARCSQARYAGRNQQLTEIEVAELTDGQDRALSGHKKVQAYKGYAKKSLERALPATRKRYAHLLENRQATNLQKMADSDLQKIPEEQNDTAAELF
ncbi:hypothetical protein [Rhodoplanes sp. Z2-YC6860]|uniref:hypothetical protein n=1 Tax=Rhodoplanes sp. Z2-YC6860 TaxID=674703 RepID=UPI00078DF010|nr:hypothetical protein [Rhodoplanes sp. Z2-YC6860]AMN41095.1 hypothetical protein RHPLAN_26570 [Rhodoplanes sp. Z2-YC6860]